jgi:hypothetical protein
MTILSLAWQEVVQSIVGRTVNRMPVGAGVAIKVRLRYSGKLHRYPSKVGARSTHPRTCAGTGGGHFCGEGLLPPGSLVALQTV